MADYKYTLFATDNKIMVPLTPDPCGPRTELYIWGFAGGLYEKDGVVVNPDFAVENGCKFFGKASFPAPRIDVECGDRLFITLVNLGMEHLPNLTDVHSVHVHGGHVATQIDGVPETAFGVPMQMDGMKPKCAPPNPSGVDPNQAITYYFAPEHPGTYFYHCHQEASEHVQMGMYGALIVHPSKEHLDMAGVRIPRGYTNRNFAYADKDTFFHKEYVLLLSDVDQVWHQYVFDGLKFFPADFKSTTWLVNGRSYPDTLLPTQVPASLGAYSVPPGYESYVHVKTGERFLIRLINMGYQTVPWHIHGWHFRIIGKDAHPMPANPNDKNSRMAFTQLVGSGESYDLLLTADNKQPLYGSYIFNGFPGVINSLMEQVKKAEMASQQQLWANIPEDGTFTGECPFEKLFNFFNYGQQPQEFFPQFYIMHNHDDYKVTTPKDLANPASENQCLYPGGQLCFMQIDAPPTPGPCRYPDDCTCEKCQAVESTPIKTLLQTLKKALPWCKPDSTA